MASRRTAQEERDLVLESNVKYKEWIEDLEYVEGVIDRVHGLIERLIQFEEGLKSGVEREARLQAVIGQQRGFERPNKLFGCLEEMFRMLSSLIWHEFVHGIRFFGKEWTASVLLSLFLSYQ